jgi:cytochrome c oxidase assembly protein subunit 15
MDKPHRLGLANRAMTAQALPAASPISAERRIGLWLMACAVLVFAMVLLGGLTRLTESGLSIVEWKPVTGVLPPIGEAAWAAEFAKYQATPEYQKVNRGMSLVAFQRIWWVEYAHRLLGRLIGAAFLLPFLWFLARGQVPARLKGHLWLVFLLGAAQGAVGWYMVRSGLVDRPDVSQYRLALHLGLALVIYLYLLRLTFDLLWPAERQGSPLAWVVLALCFGQTLLGALVAGLDAGLHYNTFPLMDGALVPPGLATLEPWWLNLFENPITVQFQHRLGAYVVVAAVFWLWWRKAHPVRHWLLAALALQVGLGIATLVLVVPLPLALAHQGGAVLLLSAALLVTR